MAATVPSFYLQRDGFTKVWQREGSRKASTAHVLPSRESQIHVVSDTTTTPHTFVMECTCQSNHLTCTRLRRKVTANRFLSFQTRHLSTTRVWWAQQNKFGFANPMCTTKTETVYGMQGHQDERARTMYGYGWLRDNSLFNEHQRKPSSKRWRGVHCPGIQRQFDSKQGHVVLYPESKDLTRWFNATFRHFRRNKSKLFWRKKKLICAASAYQLTTNLMSHTWMPCVACKIPTKSTRVYHATSFKGDGNSWLVSNQLTL